MKNKWPGLAAEGKVICERLGLQDVNLTECSKNEYKTMIHKASRREDEVLMRKGMEGKTKMNDIVTESCLIKDYFKLNSMSKTREIFRVRTNMNDVKGNFKITPGGAVLYVDCKRRSTHL